MAKYSFRLETLQRVREARRDEHRAALAEAFQAENILAKSRAELAAQADEMRTFQRSATAGRYTNVNQLLEAQRYDLLLKARSQDLAKQAVLLAAETERRRQALIEADRDVRSLERLDERHEREFKRDAERQATKQLDEVAANRWRTKRDTRI
jgi:flagellar export protein FliJ